MSAADLAIDTRDLTKSYGARVAVDRLNLKVRRGSIFGFLGPNGAGKSTTLQMLCGFLPQTSGECRVLGLSPRRDRAELKRVIGYMPQRFGLYEYLSVRENLAFFAALYSASRGEAADRAVQAAARVKLEGRLDDAAGALSGGWKQRLALACAILHEPVVLFLDEPTMGVDPVSRRIFWDLLHDLNERGVTIFVTTHYMEEVERCHEVALISGGRLTTAGTPDALKADIAERRDFVSVTAGTPARALAALRASAAVCDAYFYGNVIHAAALISAAGNAATRIGAGLAASGIPDAVVRPREATMEDVFIEASASTNGDRS